MSKEAVFTMMLEPELRDEFMAEAAAAHRPASQVARELMREYVQRQRQAREYDDFLATKVQASRRSLQAGEGIDNIEVEAQFAQRRVIAARLADLVDGPADRKGQHAEAPRVLEQTPSEPDQDARSL